MLCNQLSSHENLSSELQLQIVNVFILSFFLPLESQWNYTVAGIANRYMQCVGLLNTQTLNIDAKRFMSLEINQELNILPFEIRLV